jgi:quercetin dioxygenase-like cupin family protein
MGASLSGPLYREAMQARVVVGAIALALALAGCGGGGDAAESSAPESSGVLLDAQRLTALDQQITYPKRKPAEITSVVVTLEPGQETGWVRHRVPVVMHVLEGTLSVEFDAGVTKSFTAGTAFVQAQGVDYNASNTSDQVARVLQVFIGAAGVPNTVERP